MARCGITCGGAGCSLFARGGFVFTLVGRKRLNVVRGTIGLCDGKGAATDGVLGGADFDFDVVAEMVETLH